MNENNRYPVPELTAEERIAALDKGMRIRVERAEFRRRLKRGEASLGEALAASDAGSEWAANMRVKMLVSAMPGYGFAKTRDLMHDLGISEGRHVRGLGCRQRRALVAALEGGAL